MKNANILLVLSISILFLFSCKEEPFSPSEEILGTWISVDKSDTIIFTDKTNLWRPYINGHHFDYKLIRDSIKIGYHGILYIYIIPTMHKYYLNGNNLRIDFSNTPCYGFDQRVIDYTRMEEPFSPPEGYESVIAKDFTGLDGCGILLKKISGEFLEPSNIDSFSTKLRDGKIYWIRYENDTLHGSYCMAGDVIVLLDLKEPYKFEIK